MIGVLANKLNKTHVLPGHGDVRIDGGCSAVCDIGKFVMVQGQSGMAERAVQHRCRTRFPVAAVGYCRIDAPTERIDIAQRIYAPRWDLHIGASAANEIEQPIAPPEPYQVVSLHVGNVRPPATREFDGCVQTLGAFVVALANCQEKRVDDRLRERESVAVPSDCVGDCGETMQFYFTYSSSLRGLSSRRTRQITGLDMLRSGADLLWCAITENPKNQMRF